jgi:glycosyltransferase involved in cell wall biosynthesis
MRVSCIVTAYNYGRYVAGAIESVLAQTYDGEIEIVVVDDGSTDDTPHVVEPYLDRVRYLRKENGGLNSAYQAGLAAATGDVLAFLDADDEWPADRLERQVAILAERPEVGLVYGDLEVIGPDGEHVHPSYLRMHRIRPRRGNILGTLIHDNIVTGGSAIVRAAFLDRILPIPEWAAFPDWWVALRAAEVSDVEYVRGSVYRYRLHGDNMGFGVDPRVRLTGPVKDRELPFRRELLVRTAPGLVAAEHLLVAHRRFVADWTAVAEALGQDVRTLVPVEAERAARARAALDAAAAAFGDDRLDHAVAHLVASLADDPFQDDAATLLDQAARLVDGRPAAVAAVELDARSFRVAADAAELADDPALLDSFLASFSPADDVTLAAPTSAGDDVALGSVAAAVEAAGDAVPDVAAVAAGPADLEQAAVAAAVHAVLSDRPRTGACRRLPRVGKADPAALRQLAARRRPGRVLVGVDYFHPSVGGSERVGADVAALLTELGYEVDVATRALAERRDLCHRGAEIKELDHRVATAELQTLVREGDYDVIFSLGHPMTWPILSTLELADPGPRRIVWPTINPESHAQVNADPAFREHYRRQLGRADAVLFSAFAGFDAQLLRELGHEGGVYLPNAIALTEPDGPFRARAGVPEGAPLLLHVANLWPEKNHLGLLATLRDHPGDWRLVLLGSDSPEHPALGDRIREAVAADPRVTLIQGAAAPTVAAALDEADLFLLPSNADATPLVLIEAMSRGVPFLASPNCGSAPDHAGGIVLPVDRFPQAIDRLLADPGARAELGRAGRLHWEACYCWDALRPRYDALMQGAALPPLAPPPGVAEATAAVRAAVLSPEVQAA